MVYGHWSLSLWNSLNDWHSSAYSRVLPDSCVPSSCQTWLCEVLSIFDDMKQGCHITCLNHNKEGPLLAMLLDPAKHLQRYTISIMRVVTGPKFWGQLKKKMPMNETNISWNWTVSGFHSYLQVNPGTSSAGNIHTFSLFTLARLKMSLLLMEKFFDVFNSYSYRHNSYRWLS